MFGFRLSRLHWMMAWTLIAVTFGGQSPAATIAHWDFESELINGSPMPGTVVPHTAGTAVFQASIPDLSGNGNHLSAYHNNGGASQMQFSGDVAPTNGTDSMLSMESDTGTAANPQLFTDGDLQLGGSSVGDLPAFTIEASVYFKSLTGWHTFIGLDGVGTGGDGSFYDDGVETAANDPNTANFYFQRKGIEDNSFRFNFTATDGNSYIVDSTTVPVVDQWYNVAVTSDGTNLRLYVNRELEQEMDMAAASGSSSPITMVGLDEGGTATTDDAPYAWSFFRGMYSNGHGDYVNGFMDDVRISNQALSPEELLNPGISPLTIYVNTSTGEVTMQNDGAAPISFNYYIIESEMGALDPTDGSGWNSLSDQNIDPATLPGDFNGDSTVDGADLTQWEGDYGVNGDSDANNDGDSDGLDFLAWQRNNGQSGGGVGLQWDEAAGVSENALAELFLNGQTTLDPTESISLGNAFDETVFGGGNEGDLRFSIGLDGGLDLTQATVVYTNTSITAVPEPTTLCSLFLSAAMVLGVRRPCR